jgi:hypothetical protein
MSLDGDRVIHRLIIDGAETPASDFEVKIEINDARLAAFMTAQEAAWQRLMAELMGRHLFDGELIIELDGAQLQRWRELRDEILAKETSDQGDGQCR